MKKIILVSLLTLSLFGSQVEARCCYRGGWIAPALVGGVIGYELSRPYYAPPPVVYTTPPSVVYVQPPVVQQTIPPGYHWSTMVDPQTNQQKMVLVPN